MKVSRQGIDVITGFEALRLNCYLDPIGLKTIGYGHLVKPGESYQVGDRITLDEAVKLFTTDLAIFETGVESLLTRLVTQNEFDALVSFAFNVGLANCKKSSVLKLANLGVKGEEIEAKFLQWNKAGGKVLRGLTRRRQTEANVYNYAIYTLVT